MIHNYKSYLNFIKESLDIKKIKSRELQKLRLIPLDNFAASEAISNIMFSEIKRQKFDYEMNLTSLMSLDLSKTKIRNRFRFNDYYKRFYKSRSRGFHFEGLISGLLGGEVSESLDSPYDIIIKEGKISCKVVRDLSESVVLKGVSYSLGEYIDNYSGSVENKNILKKLLDEPNPVSYLLSTKNNDLKNIAEDLIDSLLKNIDGVLIGVPNENFELFLYYFDRNKLRNILLTPGMTVKPKTKGSKQIRFSTKIFRLTDSDKSALKGKIKFPIISDEEYAKFLLGDDNTKKVLKYLNTFGERYGVDRFGDNIPQDLIADLSNNPQFFKDMDNLL